MIHAYDETLLHKAQLTLANMLETAVFVYGYSLNEFYCLFLNSFYCKRFEHGESSVVAGMSGRELAYEIINDNKPIDMLKAPYTVQKSPEYWVGWSLGYYQWYCGKSFREINDIANIDSLYSMYNPYHEMDIMQFVDAIEEKANNHQKSQLKRLRLYAGLTQKELSERTDIPLRTIQQYEQGQKDISHARADSIVKLAKALYCNVEDII